MASELLKLSALDEEDLAVISAHLQDAVILVGDMTYQPALRRFALVANRFDWDGEARGKGRRRRRCGLHFARVHDVKAQAIRQGRADAVLSLLAIEFEPTDPPAGRIRLVFSGGGAIRLEVECIEAAMADLGPAWSTERRPRHALEDEPGPR